MKIKVTQLLLFYFLIAFYLFAGYNHFAKPTFYLPIIPPYLSTWAKEINILSGIVEIILALLLIPKATRSLAAKGIIMMLIAFIPTHIFFIQKGYFVLGTFRITPLISYVRLFVGQPILILWAWWSSKIEVDLFKKCES
jgi:uncharacterized membrane protein